MYNNLTFGLSCFSQKPIVIKLPFNLFLLLFFCLFRFTIFGSILVLKHSHEVKKNSSKMNAEMVSRAVERCAHQVCAHWLHAAFNHCIICYVLFVSTVYGKKIVLDYCRINNCRMYVFQVTVSHIQP